MAVSYFLSTRFNQISDDKERKKKFQLINLKLFLFSEISLKNVNWGHWIFSKGKS